MSKSSSLEDLPTPELSPIKLEISEKPIIDEGLGDIEELPSVGSVDATEETSSIISDDSVEETSSIISDDATDESVSVDSDKSIEELLSKNIEDDSTDKIYTDDESSDEEDYLIKFNDSIRTNIIENFHKELKQSNYDEISALTKVVRDEYGNVIDPIHTTVPFLTKFESAKVLGLRAKQINNGSETFVKVPETIIDGYIIAQMELKAKVIPFIIARPLPNGKKEYWKLADLELIDY